MINKFNTHYFKNNNYNFKKYENTDQYYNLLLIKRHSNIFLVLSEKNFKHITTLTAGFCKLGRKKKEKKAVHNISLMVKVLLELLNAAKIKYIHIYLKQRFSSHFFYLCKLLRRNNIRIIKFIYLLRIPHGHKKKRKLRRI